MSYICTIYNKYIYTHTIYIILKCAGYQFVRGKLYLKGIEYFDENVFKLAIRKLLFIKQQSSKFFSKHLDFPNSVACWNSWSKEVEWQSCKLKYLTICSVFFPIFQIFKSLNRSNFFHNWTGWFNSYTYKRVSKHVTLKL